MSKKWHTGARHLHLALDCCRDEPALPVLETAHRSRRLNMFYVIGVVVVVLVIVGYFRRF
jgi:hypothetical protein